MGDKLLIKFIYGMVQVQQIQKKFTTAKMVSVHSMRMTIAFGEGQFTLQLTLHILVDILSGMVMPTNFLMGTNYLMEAHYLPAPRSSFMLRLS